MGASHGIGPNVRPPVAGRYGRPGRTVAPAWSRPGWPAPGQGPSAWGAGGGLAGPGTTFSRAVEASSALAPADRADAASRRSRQYDDTAHPLADTAATAALRQRAADIDAAFSDIKPLLQRLAARQFESDFEALASAELDAALGIALPEGAWLADWRMPLDMRRIHAQCVLRSFARLLAQQFDRSHAESSEGESAETLIRRWGFHALDITPCADGRLAGVIDFILRVPPAVVAFRKSRAGAMFDVAESLRHWEAVELRRWREGRPNPASEPTRFLKIGVYHYSGLDPDHEGCAAHGSDAARAAGALLERLGQFEQAVQHTHCCGAAVATLLIGVDTDTDAIRVHVPDAAGRMTPGRFVDNRQLYQASAALSRESAKEAIRAAVADCAGVAGDDAATEGMRWFCAYLLKNNLAQIDAVRAWHGGAYPDLGHTERLIVVGDALDGVQLRNLAFQAQMDSIEEGAADLEVGVRILGSAHRPRGLAVPVLVHRSFDARIPGGRERAVEQAQRMCAAVQARFGQQCAAGELHVEAAVTAAAQEEGLQFVAATSSASAGGCGSRESHR